MKESYQTGVRGERLAAEYLLKKGMTLLESRYRAAGGEIDLILRDREVIVFAEVKYRPSEKAGFGLFAIDRSKRKRLTRAASVYLMKYFPAGAAARFDVIEISADGILHIPNAFPAEG